MGAQGEAEQMPGLHPHLFRDALAGSWRTVSRLCTMPAATILLKQKVPGKLNSTPLTTFWIYHCNTCWSRNERVRLWME